MFIKILGIVKDIITIIFTGIGLYLSWKMYDLQRPTQKYHHVKPKISKNKRRSFMHKRKRQK